QQTPEDTIQEILQNATKIDASLLRASNELVYITHRQGGANVPRMGDLCDVAVITHAFRLLTCPDATVRNIVANALQDATKKRIMSHDNTIVTPSARGMLERTLKAAVHSLYVETLKRKPDQ
ncbi:hypothetical protein G0U57_018779, partial [Chelydra serpentina]